MIMDIRDFFPLTDRLATAGQPTMEQFADIKAAGYEIVINLVPMQSPHYMQDEQALVEGMGMEYVGICVDWGCPTSEDLHCFFSTMDSNPHRKIFVHCAANKRASAFTFLYRVLRQDVDETDAEDDLEQIWVPGGTWRHFINEMLSKKPALIK